MVFKSRAQNQKAASNGKFTCSICSKSLTTRPGLKRHEFRHTGKKPHICTFCSMAFTDRTNMIQHVQTHTGEKRFPCPVCKRAYSTSSNLKVHARVHTGEKPYACDRCPKTFACSQNFTVHKRAHSDEKSFSCNLCDKSYKSRPALDRHLRVHTGEKPIPCNLCERRFYTHSELAAHRNRQHPEDRRTSRVVYKCDICDRLLASATGLRLHKKAAHGKLNAVLYPCLECGMNFRLQSYLRAHQKSIHSSVNGVECSFCGVLLKTRENLLNHIRRKHTGEKQYTCPASAATGCGLAFFSKAEATSHHRAVHLRASQERPHTCPLCDKSFPTKSALTQHTRTHTGEPPYPCPRGNCDKRFITSGGLKAHMRTHSDEKLYTCPECGKGYRSQQSVTFHLLAVHDPNPEAGKRQCRICHKFVTASVMRGHEKVHSRDKARRPFRCESCSKSYFTKDQLAAHRITHGPKTHPCPFCVGAFHRMYQLQAHLRLHTGENI